VNHKRVYRPYSEEALSIRTRAQGGGERADRKLYQNLLIFGVVIMLKKGFIFVEYLNTKTYLITLCAVDEGSAGAALKEDVTSIQITQPDPPCFTLWHGHACAKIKIKPDAKWPG
jgi:hypothetical protein